MTRTFLRQVYPYPATGWTHVLIDDDEVIDAAVRGCRSVAELYSEALANRSLPNGVSELRLFFRHVPNLSEVRATVQVDPVREGFETAYVRVPTAFLDCAPQVRAGILLEVIDGVVRRLAPARGWSADELDACRDHVLEADLEYRWVSAPKASPDRRHTARAVFRLLPDGWGRVCLQIRRRDDGSLVAESPEAVAVGTDPGFRRAARSLRWQGSGEVSLVPFDWVPAHRGGLVRMRDVAGAWVSEVEEFAPVLPVPAGDPAARPLSVWVGGEGRHAPEARDRIVFVGGGPIQTARTEAFQTAFSAEMVRFCSVAGQHWWGAAGLGDLRIRLSYECAQPRVRLRQGDRLLAVFVDRPEATLADADPESLARRVAEDVVDAVRRRTGLGPHPGFPEV